MHEYYLIQSFLTSEFWNEEKQEFDSLANGTKYLAPPMGYNENMGNNAYDQLIKASEKRICVIVKIYCK